MRHPRNGAFTLIELLIVVAIIAILAAIAAPNFLEAQTRAKVSRAYSDLRTLITALESYHVDNNAYPTATGVFTRLSTPIAYVTSTYSRDPFGTAQVVPPLPPDVYGYTNLGEARWGSDLPLLVPPSSVLPILNLRWLATCRGPDRELEIVEPGTLTVTPPRLSFFFNGLLTGDSIYDPTNGTVSDGDIVACQRGILTAPI